MKEHTSSSHENVALCAEVLEAVKVKTSVTMINAIPFNVATSPSYFNMIHSKGVHGCGLKHPPTHDLRT
ncbi:hypothetical protein M5K25_005189 [Dendrobium thyrsiflorum]|uniref:Uncharacterized protein n=1 Tax=Dendrobium thyrsiflorum TaxID=117978 RepID=A0ABD0VHA9_DENTH